jgi:cyclase
MKGKADAVLAASIFHFDTYTVGDVKQFLKRQNIPVRL